MCVPAGPSSDDVRDALAELDPDGRIGSPERPLFLAAGSVLYLGLTGEARDWLARHAGEAFAAAQHAALTAALGGHLPADPVEQVRAALAAGGELVVMPLGLGQDSGSGFAWSAPDGGDLPTGVYRANATGTQLLVQGGDDLRSQLDTAPWAQALQDTVRQAGQPVRVDFVVERGRLWVLEVRPAPLSGTALLRSLSARRPNLDDVLATVRDADVVAALAPSARVDGLAVAATGLGVSPGAVGGVVVRTAADAVAMAAAGGTPVLVLPESRPEDLPGLLAAVAVVTARGGRTSHAAVVARGLGKPCVTALHEPIDTVLREGDDVTVDGSTGVVHRGRRDGVEPAGVDVEWLVGALRDAPGPRVRVNADNATDAVRGTSAGATGVGLCRVEHMFLGDRQQLLERVLLSPPGPESAEALRALETLLRADFVELLSAMSGLPVVIRLLDPPRHEFLPDLVELTAEAAAVRHAGGEPDVDRVDAVRRLSERNPMLGVRGARLGILVPDLTTTQVRAILDAARLVRRAGGDPRPELLLPMVADPSEVDEIRRLTGPLPVPLGVMIETPRAALLAAELAPLVDFFSIGTNDLTALVWGLSRDDAEQDLLPAYRALGVVPASPFEEFDVRGVGSLVRAAVTGGRAANPDLVVGVCGEHAAESAAVAFFAELGVDYVSCSPPRVPVAALAAARAGVAAGRKGVG